MATLFTKIIEGESPGRFVWRDAHCVALLAFEPIRAGHTLIVPRREIDHWIDLGPELTAHVFGVGQMVSRAIQRGFGCRKVGLTILGLAVPHCHLHLMPADRPEDMDLARQQKDVPSAELDAAAATIRTALHELGLADRALAIE